MIKLAPSEEQHQALLQTMESFNAACNYVSKLAFESRTFGQFYIHRLCYYEIRQRFGLSAQMTIRAVAKVSESYKADRSRLHIFRPRGGIVYDDRILSWKGPDKVSIWTTKGRQTVPIRIGAYQAARLDRKVRQSDLILSDGKFYLALVVDAPEPDPDEPDGFLGVDMGIVNIAADSDGKVYAGGHLNGLRKRYAKVRTRLQSKGTKAAKRLLKKRHRKEHRFARHVNHKISKDVVTTAKDTGRGIALENLKGIRSRTTVRKGQRRQYHSWTFNQLRRFVEYKAKLAGVVVKLVDPRNTSRTCPDCGCVDKRNRPSQSLFKCVSCNFSSLADTVAARIIAGRAASKPATLLDRANGQGKAVCFS